MESELRNVNSEAIYYQSIRTKDTIFQSTKIFRILKLL